MTLITLEEKKLNKIINEMDEHLREQGKELLRLNQLYEMESLECVRLEKEVLEISQEERKHFGSELHDGLCQVLSGLLMFIKTLTQKMEAQKSPELTELKNISEILENAAGQARDMARGLYPGAIEGSSLISSLENLASQEKGAACFFYCSEPIIIDDDAIATHFYRIAQEAIGNAIKHGKAKKIEMFFTCMGGNITLVVKDDGIGIDPDLKNSKGIGLKTMAYRAHMMNASFHIRPDARQGNIVECSLKRPEEKNKRMNVGKNLREITSG